MRPRDVSKASIVLFVLAVIGCGSYETPTFPSVTDTPSAPAPGPSPSPPLSGVRVQGHLIDAETGESISRANVTVTDVC
jgi:hypothetical protein